MMADPDRRPAWRRILLLGALLLGFLAATPARAAEVGVTLQVRVRAGDGTPVGGLGVTCAPQPAALGGPLGAPRAVTAVTDARGQAGCAALAGGIWAVQFTGAVAGVPVQPVAAQGQPPYGRTRGGGGFPVALDPTGGDEGASLLTPLAGPLGQDAAFTGQERAGVWVPELDRQTADGRPTPESGFPLLAVAPTLVAGAPAGPERPATVVPPAGPGTPARTGPARPPPAAAGNTTADAGWSPGLLGLCYLPLLLAGAGMVGHWGYRQVRRARRPAGRGAVGKGR